MEFFVIENGEQSGPYTRFKIREKISKGEIDQDTLGWYRGLEDWKPLSEIKALQTALAEGEGTASGAALPGEETEGEEEEEGEEEGATVERPDSESAYSPAIRAWIRFWARNLDFLYFFSVTSFIGIASGQMTTLEFLRPSIFYLLILMAAWAFFETVLLSVVGTTPGRMFLNIRLTREDGSRLTTGVALKRSLCVWFRGMGFGFPYFSLVTMAVSYLELTKTGTTWWDDRAGTLVRQGQVKLGRVILALAITMFLYWLIISVGGFPAELLEDSKPAGDEAGREE